jgi:hypothetical protein
MKNVFQAEDAFGRYSCSPEIPIRDVGGAGLWSEPEQRW